MFPAARNGQFASQGMQDHFRDCFFTPLVRSGGDMTSGDFLITSVTLVNLSLCVQERGPGRGERDSGLFGERCCPLEFITSLCKAPRFVSPGG